MARPRQLTILLISSISLGACAFADRMELERHPVFGPVLVNKNVIELRRCLDHHVSKFPSEEHLSRHTDVSWRWGDRIFFVFVDDHLFHKRMVEQLTLLKRGEATEVRAYALDDRVHDMRAY